MTKDEFVKKYHVGDKIRAPHWKSNRFSEVLYLGDKEFFVRDDDNAEGGWEYSDYDWQPYTAPQKTVKMSQAVYKWRGLSQTHQISSLFFKSKKEAETDIQIEIVQWPIVVNGVEQWIEVEE